MVLYLPGRILICCIQFRYQITCRIFIIHLPASVKKIKLIPKAPVSVHITMNKNGIRCQMKKLISHIFIFQRSSHHCSKYLSAIGSHRRIFRSRITKYPECLLKKLHVFGFPAVFCHFIQENFSPVFSCQFFGKFIRKFFQTCCPVCKIGK